MDANKEDPLRPYIREKLLDYALTHLTVDYASFTENAVVDLLTKSLVKVSDSDPNSITLPLDPFEVLTRSYRLNELTRHDEKWTTDEESVNYVRKVVAISGMAMTERCWLEEGDRELEANYEMSRPMSPILTTRAMKATPRLGSGEYRQQFPKSFSDALNSKFIQRLDNEDTGPPSHLKLDDVLDVKTVLDIETHAEMVSLLKTVMFRPDPTFTNTHVETFMHGHDPSASCLYPETLFVPIFPRKHIVGSAGSSVNQHSPKGLKNLADLTSLLPSVEIEDDTRDRHKEHMVIVDGWNALVSSPASLATPTSSQLDQRNQIDELFMQSSPNTDIAPIQMLANAKMDEIEIPRTRKLGGAPERTVSKGEGQSFASFILPFIPAPSQGFCIATASFTPQSPQQSVSLVGQATSVNGDNEQVRCAPVLDGGSDEMDLDTAIGRTYASVQGQAPEEIIMLEKLDEKDGQLLDVPDLPPPNIHPGSGMYLPDSLSSLVDIVQGKKKDVGQVVDVNASQQKVLRKVKGIHSLAMDLSWIPFKSRMKGITHEHGANVLEFSGGSLGECDADEVQVKKLLDQIADNDSVHGLKCDHQEREDLWLGIADSVHNMRVKEFSYASDGSEMALTREERGRISGITDGQPNPVDQPNSGNQEAHYSNRSARELPNASFNAGPVDEQSDMNDQRNVVDPVPALTLVSDMLCHPAHRPVTGSDYLACDDRDASGMPECGNRSTPGTQWQYYKWPESMPEVRDCSHLEAGEPLTSAPHGVEITPFMPLSFDSHREISVVSSQSWLQPYAPQEVLLEPFSSLSPEFPIPDQSHPAPDIHGYSEPELLVLSQHESEIPPKNSNAELSLAVVEFARLRSREFARPEIAAPQVSEMPLPVAGPTPEPPTPEVPVELIDNKTVCLQWPQPFRATTHRYLASIDVIQKQCLIRSFRAEQCLVDLIERDTLGGVDIIIDPHTAILFTSFHDLPSQCESLVAHLGLQSWRYSNLLVVLEAYPERLSYRPDRNTSAAVKLNPYTPPNVKAVKKLRRDLSISEGFGTKSPACIVYLSFANTVEEAACVARSFGDCAEASDDTQGALWGTREWIDYPPHEVSRFLLDLASLDGMNAFAAFVILCQKPLQEFLDLTPESRLEEFGPLIGIPRVGILNKVLSERYQTIESAMSSETMQDLDSAAGILA